MDGMHIKRKDVFFTNLLLLGFDVRYMTKKHGIEFKRDMFDVPNQKGFEVVTHFLFTKLNEVVREEYKILWPILDKALEREFVKTCKTHLTAIAKEDTGGVHIPHIGQILMTPGGSNKFYELYMSFSSYVMQKTIAKDKFCRQLYRPTLNAQNRKHAKEILQLSAVVSTQRFTEVQKAALSYQQRWQEAAGDFISFYRKTKQSILEKQKLCKEELNSLVLLCSAKGENKSSLSNQDLSATSKFQTAATESSNLLNEVLCNWNALVKCLSNETEHWKIVRTELEAENVEKFVLDGRNYIIAVPEVLKEKCKNELQERGVQSLTDGNKLSVKSFLNLYFVTLDYYKQIFDKAGLPNSDGLAADLTKNIELLESYLSQAESLSKRLVHEVLPDVISQKQRLEQAAYAQLSSADFEAQPMQFPPHTPTLTFTPGSKRSSLVVPVDVLKLTPYTEQKVFPSSSMESCQCPSNSYMAEASGSAVKNQSSLTQYDMPTSSLLCKDFQKLKLSRVPLKQIPNACRVQQPEVHDDFTVSKPALLECDKSPVRTFATERGWNQNHKSSASCLDTTIAWESSSTIEDSHENFNMKYNHDSDALDKVQRDFVDQIVKKFEDDSPNVSSEEASCDFRNFISSPGDLLGKRAFFSHDKLTRTPTCSTFDVNAVKEFSRLSSHLQCYDEELDDALGNWKSADLGKSSWPEGEEEFLDNVTLPDVPI